MIKLTNKEEICILMILLAIAFSSNNFPKILISILIIAYIVFYKKERYGGFTTKDLKRLLKWFFLPCGVIHLYTILLATFGVFNIKVISTNLITYLPILVAIFLVYQYGAKACFYVLISIFISFLISFLPKFFDYGFVGIINALKSFFLIIDNSGGSVFEMDDIVLAVGYFLIIFLNPIFAKVIKNKQLLLIFFLIYLFVLVFGGKRIDVLASFITLLLFFILNKCKKDKRKFASLLLGYIIVISGFLLVYLLSFPNLLDFVMDKTGINLMSRNYFWNSIIKTTSISPFFLGYGRGSVKIWMLNHFSPYQNVHCDYIKMFVEIGTIPYILWLYYYSIYLVKKIWQCYGMNAGITYLLTAVFTFILYLTDNTESYYICNMVRCLIPISIMSIKMCELN